MSIATTASILFTILLCAQAAVMHERNETNFTIEITGTFTSDSIRSLKLSRLNLSSFPGKGSEDSLRARLAPFLESLVTLPSHSANSAKTGPRPQTCWEQCYENCSLVYGGLAVDSCIQRCNCTCPAECRNLCVDFGLGPECLAKCGCLQGLYFGKAKQYRKYTKKAERNIGMREWWIGRRQKIGRKWGIVLGNLSDYPGNAAYPHSRRVVLVNMAEDPKHGHEVKKRYVKGVCVDAYETDAGDEDEGTEE